MKALVYLEILDKRGQISGTNSIFEEKNSNFVLRSTFLSIFSYKLSTLTRTEHVFELITTSRKKMGWF